MVLKLTTYLGHAGDVNAKVSKMLTQQRVEYHIVLIIRVHVPSVRRDRPQFHRQGVPGISVVVHSVIVTPRSCKEEGYKIYQS